MTTDAAGHMKDGMYAERYGDRFLTVFNDSGEQAEVTIDLYRDLPLESRNVLSGREIAWQTSGQYGKAAITLDSEDVAVITLAR